MNNKIINLGLDIDGTIIDMLPMILYVLHAYDRTHNTQFFRDLRLSDINVHENQVERLLAQLYIPPPQQEDILAWYLEQRWSSAAITRFNCGSSSPTVP